MRAKEGWAVKCVIAASAVVFLMAGPARAVLVQCETFDRSNTRPDAPQFVRDFLDDPKALYVSVCGGGDPPRYALGASDLVRDGNVCRHSLYGFFSRTSSPRLEREMTPTTVMAVSESSTCPSPRPGNYASTNNVPQDVFERLVHFWRDATSSPASFERMFSGVSNADLVSQLNTAIFYGRSRPRMVAMRRDLGLWKSYELDIADPDHPDRSFNVTVSSWFGRAWQISDIREAVY
jgi:hypothetical protein